MKRSDLLQASTSAARVSDPADPWLDVWLLRLPRHDKIAHLIDQSHLDDHERHRGSTFLRPADSVLYLSAHIALRLVLARYLDLAPQHVPFVREPCPGCGEPHGRPAVAVPDPPFHFSLSHSRGMALVGVASAPVGADVEGIPRTSTVDNCVPALHPDEQRELAGTSPEARHEAFGRIWTRKEAYLKGLGTGLSRQPSLDYLGADATRRPAGWSFIDLPCAPHHNGAVALRAPVTEPTSVHRLPVDVLFGAPALSAAV
ncbi:4'-phosphopantetheinyl transferase superfamily protein (plasmid) [Streptomyces sp. NBC_01471]|uniref:4'-phosphopantetheinyl transferase family protein n=1 Tax=Streptomyces sp. NBC_01471 TaxID=2903879 RepID=UPI002F91B03D